MSPEYRVLRRKRRPLTPPEKVSTMKLSTYQEHALSTAMETSLSREYLVPYIIGEIGEVFGKIAKAHRDGWSADRLQKEAVSEYGDVAWGAAVLLYLLGVDGETGFQFNIPDDPKTALLGQALDLLLADRDDNNAPWLDEVLEALWYTLRHHCLEITGVEFDEVLAINVAKLQDRAARNVIAGSGDNR